MACFCSQKYSKLFVIAAHLCIARCTECTLYKTGMNHNKYLKYLFRNKDGHKSYDTIKMKFFCKRYLSKSNEKR